MVNVLLVGVIAVVIVLLILGALDRWNVFGDDRENPESGTDRVKQESRREGDYSVSLLKKHKTLTLPAKVLAVSLGVLVLATGVFAYFSLKNGAPAEVPYSNYLEAGAIATVAIAGGVAYRGKKDSQRGEIEVVYEDNDGAEEGSETVYYDPSETTTNKDGNLVVYEHFPARILGLFGRRKLVAHDRELRAERGILSDIVAHEIPEHAVRLDEDHHLIRTQERIVTKGVSNAADYRYRTPIELPYQTHLQQRERMEKLESRIDTKDAVMGEIQTQLGELQRRLETQETTSHEEALEKIIDIMDHVQMGQKNVEIRTDRTAQRMPKDQREVAQNGSEVDN